VLLGLGPHVHSVHRASEFAGGAGAGAAANGARVSAAGQPRAACPNDTYVARSPRTGTDGLVQPACPAWALSEAAAHWHALQRWTDDAYLAGKLGERAITVAVTPTGYADAVHDGVFVRPHEERMPYTEFLRRLHAGPDVHYVQLQNSNLTTDDEFAPLLDDIERDMPFATEALGPSPCSIHTHSYTYRERETDRHTSMCAQTHGAVDVTRRAGGAGTPPDAVNVWIGNHLSTTWVHKDPYENLYTVVTGAKHFTLFPPCDYPWLYEQPYPTGQWARDPASATATQPEGLLKIVRDHPTQTVPWIAVRATVQPGHEGGCSVDLTDDGGCARWTRTTQTWAGTPTLPKRCRCT
jgi:hypothetical protein